MYTEKLNFINKPLTISEDIENLLIDLRKMDRYPEVSALLNSKFLEKLYDEHQDLLNGCLTARAILNAQGINSSNEIVGEKYNIICAAITKAEGGAS